MNKRKPLREIMLDVHQEQLKKMYELPHLSRLHYNDESTQICVSGVPLFKYFEREMFDPDFLNKLRSEREQRRDKLVQAHKHARHLSAQEFFHLQFDYEMLGLDHLVDAERVNSLSASKFPNMPEFNLLKTSSGKTFYEEVIIKELESLGNQLISCSPRTNESYYFSDKDFDHFVRHTATRTKLIRMVLDNETVISELKSRHSELRKIYPEHDCVNAVYDRIKELRIDQMRRRAVISSLQNKFPDAEKKYLRFVSDALDYNEDNRLLRSISFFYVMKDKSVPGNFYDLLEVRKLAA